VLKTALLKPHGLVEEVTTTADSAILLPPTLAVIVQ